MFLIEYISYRFTQSVLDKCKYKQSNSTKPQWEIIAFFLNRRVIYKNCFVIYQSFMTGQSIKSSEYHPPAHHHKSDTLSSQNQLVYRLTASADTLGDSLKSDNDTMNCLPACNLFPMLGAQGQPESWTYYLIDSSDIQASPK